MSALWLSDKGFLLIDKPVTIEVYFVLFKCCCVAAAERENLEVSCS